jgi:D-lactate dehydrogenase (cytochrome)
LLREMIMERQLIYTIEDKYQEYLSDESKFIGKAESISFPESEEEILEIIYKMKKNNVQITVQGGKTGIAGCAVPSKGHILNVSNMNKVKEFIKTDKGDAFLKVEPGIRLLELKKVIKKLKSEEELFWPPDPTEPSATVGGIASCNAKGICSYLYGDSRKYIVGARIIHSDGTIKDIKRGETIIPFLDYKKDLLDLYLGGEGMFGVLTELTLKLQTKPKELWGISFFFENKEDAFTFIDHVIKEDLQNEEARMAAVEYMDRATLDVIEEKKEFMTKLKELPDVDSEISAMVYIEIHGREEVGVEEIAEKLMELAINHNSDPDKAWAVSGETEIDKMRTFRHAAAECVNLFIEKIRQKEPSITKLGTDMSLQGVTFESTIKKYEADIKKEGLRACIFGHACGIQLHVNLLPENNDQYEKGRYLFEKWAIEIAKNKGKVVTEHGVGKLKKNMFCLTAKEDYINEIKRLKSIYDSIKMWNPGNMIDD